jgi:hypothetical protein
MDHISLLPLTYSFHGEYLLGRGLGKLLLVRSVVLEAVLQIKLEKGRTNTPGLDFNMTLHPDRVNTHPTQP